MRNEQALKKDVTDHHRAFSADGVWFLCSKRVKLSHRNKTVRWTIFLIEQEKRHFCWMTLGLTM